MDVGEGRVCIYIYGDGKEWCADAKMEEIVEQLQGRRDGREAWQDLFRDETRGWAENKETLGTGALEHGRVFLSKAS